MSEIPIDPELNAIASALGDLSPVPSRIDRDRLMFEAGALSRGRTRSNRWIWPSVAAALAMALTGESLFLASRPATRVVERVVVVREPSGSAPSPSKSPPPTSSLEPVVILSQVDVRSLTTPPSSWESVSDYRRRQALVLRFGLDNFPEPIRLSSQSGGPTDASEDGPISAGALRRIELEKLSHSGDHS
jgi:hypothetical protein